MYDIFYHFKHSAYQNIDKDKEKVVITEIKVEKTERFILVFLNSIAQYLTNYQTSINQMLLQLSKDMRKI